MKLLTTSDFRRNAQIYRAMANPIRLHIMNHVRDREASASELVKVLKLPKANVSQHLAVLKYLRLVKARRDGTHVYYRLSNRRIVDPCHIFSQLRHRKVFV